MKLAIGSAAAAYESGDEGAGEPAGALGGQHKEGHVEALITMPSRVLSESCVAHTRRGCPAPRRCVDTTNSRVMPDTVAMIRLRHRARQPARLGSVARRAQRRADATAHEMP